MQEIIMNSKEQIIGDFLEKYPRGLSAWDDEFAANPFIQSIREKTENREIIAEKWNNLLADFEAYGLEAHNTTLSISRSNSCSIHLEPIEGEMQFLNVDVSLIAPVFAVYRAYANGNMSCQLVQSPDDLGNEHSFIVERTKHYFDYFQLTEDEMSRFIDRAIVEGIDKEESSHLYDLLFGPTCLLI